MNQFYCKNCNLKGHASWSRECKFYKEASERMKNKRTHGKYWFFPSAEDWTWQTKKAP